ncbi:hypothetical protein [Salinibaculum salinum]|uniref:hypothetical protein n=1 Tax=Salinibaculum salinum TaxID=3131996 RepID=UPI0030ECAD89
MISRRRLVIQGASVIAGATLAGCLDSTDSPDENAGDAGTTETTDHPFAVEEFVYTTRRARRLGEYTPRPDKTYRDREKIWIYIELSNVTPVESGPHLDSTWELLSPSGEVLVSTEESMTIPDGSLEELPNEAFVTQGIDTTAFEIPTSGEYTLNVTLTDRGSGETIDLSRSLTIRKFEFETVAFTDGEPSFDDYDRKPNRTYTRGEDVWVYTEVVNAPVDDSGRARLVYQFEVEPPEGEPWRPDDTTEEWERVQEDEILVYSRAFATYEDDPAGEYTMTISITDRTEGTRIQTTETFTLD